jgi:hypothetical protein
MTESILLVADVEDILKALSVFIPIIIWVLIQVFSGDEEEKEKKKKKKAQQQQAERRPEKQRPQDKQFRGEIDEFLKRAAERRGQQAPAEVEVIGPAPAARQPQMPETSAAAASVPVTAEVVRREAHGDEENWGSNVAEHVQDHLRRGTWADRASHFADDIGEADDRMKAHLDKVFNHDVGHLSRPLSEQARGAGAVLRADATNAHAEAIVDMLRSRDGVRQAIVINEILRRPTILD